MDDKRVVPKSKGEQVRVSRGGDSSDRVAVALLWSPGRVYQALRESACWNNSLSSEKILSTM